MFSPRQKNKNNDRCCVTGCNSNAGDELSVRFHTFPRASQSFVNRTNEFGTVERIDRLEAWKKALKICNVSSRMKVCSLHFDKKDYSLPDQPAKKRYLLKSAVPIYHLPETRTEIAKAQINKERLKRRIARDSKKMENWNKKIKTVGSNLAEPTSGEKCESDTIVNILEKPVSYSTEPILKVVEDCGDSHSLNKDADLPLNRSECFSNKKVNEIHNYQTSGTKDCKDVDVQVNTINVSPKIIDLLKTDNDLSTPTGIELFQILDLLIEMVREVNGDRFENHRMTLKEKIILTYMKLKQNVSYEFLRVLYDCYSAMHCKRIFHEMIKVLSKCLKTAIPWPSKGEIGRNLPECFKGFEDVRITLDCTEIKIQQPKNLCCQLLTYSHYKGTTTAKFMTSVSPAGNITYLSEVYGGRASDTHIFSRNDLLQMLETGDAIMVDRGFLIDEFCEKHRWKLIRPPFLKDKKQFSKAESILTSTIASARVHLERSNQRIKNFKIVGTTIPVALVPILMDIFTVICGTINLGSPIIKDDKFTNNEK